MVSINMAIAIHYFCMFQMIQKAVESWFGTSPQRILETGYKSEYRASGQRNTTIGFERANVGPRTDATAPLPSMEDTQEK